MRWGEADTRTGSVDWGAWTGVAGADTRSHTVTGLAAGSYGFQVRAMAGSLEGAVSATFLIEILARVAGLAATSGDGEVALAWTVPSPSTAIGSWEVRQKAAGASAWGAWTAIADSGAGTAAHTVGGLENGTRYAFQVSAMNSSGTLPVAESGVAHAWAWDGTTPVPPDAPAVAAAPGDAAVTLTWSAPAYDGTITGWELRHGETDAADGEPGWGAWNAIAGATAATAEHTVTGLANGTEYAFELRAVAGATKGLASQRRVARPAEPVLPPIDSIGASNVTATTLDLAWTLPEGFAGTRVRVRQRSLAEGEGRWADAATLAGDATSYTVTGLVPETRYNFMVVLETATQSSESGMLILDTPAAEPLAAEMTGSVPDGAVGGGLAGDGCRADVAVRFTDADGEAVAVAALAASDFTVENGRVGAPVVDADGLGWSVPAWAAQGLTGLMRVRLAATDLWLAGEQVFRVASDTDCAPVARNELASLALDGLALDPAFDAATTAYTAAADAETGQATVSAAAVYGTAAVSITPADADVDADGHQVALVEGDTDIAVTVTPADTDVAAQSWTVTVTRAAADPDGTRAGAVSLGAQSPAKGRQFFRGYALDRANGDARWTTTASPPTGATRWVSGVRDQSVELAVTLEDADGTTVGTAGPPKDPTKDQLYIEWLAQTIEPGTYYVRVEALADGATDYYIRFGLADAPAQAVTDADGTRAGAVALDIEGATQGAKYYSGYALDRANGDKVDYYSFTTSARHALGLGVRGQSVELKVVLEDANGNAVGIAGPPKDSTKDQLYIEWLAQTIEAGTYYIRVEALEDEATTYYLRLGLTDPPLELSVADARAREGVDAAVAFAVTLSRAASGTVTVGYATQDGTATAGDDYAATRGTLTFAKGEQEKTVSVPILDDSHDEGEETFTLKLMNARGAVIADGDATGTIVNADPIPQAWLARFGRTVTDHVVDAVTARLAAPRAAGAEATLAGQALPSWSPGGGTVPGAVNGKADEVPQADTATLLSRWMALAGQEDGPGAGFQSRALTERDFLAGTSFALTTRTGGGGGFASLWGRGVISGFDGREDDLTLDGEVTTGLIGADWSPEPGTGRWTAGLVLGHSSGSGSYRVGDCTREDVGDRQGGCGGKVAATLGGLYPWAGAALSERLSVWAAAGIASGRVTVTPDGSPAMTAGLRMSMGAAGIRSEVLKPSGGNGFALALKGDARYTATRSEKTEGMVASRARVWQVRAGIEGARPFALGDGASATPSFEIGLRLDGGDAERGAGADMGGGLAFADPAHGLRFDMKARGLVIHKARGFREWGASAAFAWDPRPETDRGLSLSLTRSWGAAPSGGMDALLARETLAGSAADDNGPEAGGFRAAGHLQGEIGYGLSLFGGDLIATPNLGFGLSDGGARDIRAGWRLVSTVRGNLGFEASLDATRREAANGDGPARHGVALGATIRW